VPSKCNDCSNHFDENGEFDRELLDKLEPLSTETTFENKDLLLLLEGMRNKLLNKDIMDDCFDKMEEKTLRKSVGVSKSTFEKMNCVMKDHSNSFALGIYLNSLVTGTFQSQIGLRYNISQPTVSRHIRQVREILKLKFVSRYLRFNAVPREVILQNTSVISSQLFNIDNSNTQVIIDGTYIYFHKSSIYYFQRQTFSIQIHV